MSQDINIKLEELFILLDNSSLIKEMKRLKQIIMENQELLMKINRVKSLNKYDPLYKELKIEIYKNDSYRKYMELEQELNLIILKFNDKLKKIIGDFNESN